MSGFREHVLVIVKLMIAFAADAALFGIGISQKPQCALQSVQTKMNILGDLMVPGYDTPNWRRGLDEKNKIKFMEGRGVDGTPDSTRPNKNAADVLAAR